MARSKDDEQQIQDGMAEYLWHAAGGRAASVPRAAHLAAIDLAKTYEDLSGGDMASLMASADLQVHDAGLFGSALAERALRTGAGGYKNKVWRGIPDVSGWVDLRDDELTWEFRPAEDAPGYTGRTRGSRFWQQNAGGEPKFKVGDVVKRTAATMRSMGIVTGPVDGRIVGYSGRFPLVQWSDMTDDEEPMPQAEAALELTRKRRNPETFTSKGERMYEEIKRGYGGDPRAKEIAARTVYARAAEGAPGLVQNASPSGPVDLDAANELSLYIENDADLHRQQAQPIRINLMRKRQNGTFDFEKSVTAWMHMVDAGAKKYLREFGTGGRMDTVFNRNTRLEVARGFANEFVTEADLGNYDNLLRADRGRR